jgi:hypothetical protein
MYAEGNDITPDIFRDLLYQAFKLAMDHYSGGPHTCTQLSTTLKAVIDSAVSLFSVCIWLFKMEKRLWFLVTQIVKIRSSTML